MHADVAAQLDLLRLADLDSQIARLRHAAQSLPQHRAITELMTQRQQVTDALVRASTEADDAAVTLDKAETDLVPVKARLQRNRARVDDGSVTDAKVLSSLNDEIAHLRKRIDTLEDEQLALMAAVEESQRQRDQLAAEKDGIEARLRQEVTDRDREVAQLSQEAKTLAAERSPLADGLPADLVALYEKLRSATGLGAAQLRRGRCGGCQLQLTVSDLDAYRRAPANEVLRCAECDRILVRTEESGL